MTKFKVDLDGADEKADHASAAEPSSADAIGAEVAEGAEGAPRSGGDAVAVAATIGVVVIGAAVIEAALIPAIVIGAAAALAPKYLPKLGERLQPLFNSTVRGTYKLGRKARSAVGEARERMNDIAAEVHAEETAVATGAAAAA